MNADKANRRAQGYSTTDKYIRSETRQMVCGLSSITKCIHKYIDIYIQRYLSVLIVSMWKKRRARTRERWLISSIGSCQKIRRKNRTSTFSHLWDSIVPVHSDQANNCSSRHICVDGKMEVFYLLLSACTNNKCLPSVFFLLTHSLSLVPPLFFFFAFFLRFFLYRWNDAPSSTHTDILTAWFYSSPINNIYTNAKRNELKSEKEKREKCARARLSSRGNQSMKVFLSHLSGSVLLHTIDVVDWQGEDFIAKVLPLFSSSATPDQRSNIRICPADLYKREIDRRMTHEGNCGSMPFLMK